MLQRLPGWHARLDAVIDEARFTPFDWSRFNCVHLAVAVVEALTGERPALAMSGVDSERAAMRVLRAMDAATLADATAQVLPEIHISEAFTGDLAAVPSSSMLGHALGVVMGERIFVIGQEFDGLGTVDLLTAERAFKVG